MNWKDKDERDEFIKFCIIIVIMMMILGLTDLAK